MKALISLSASALLCGCATIMTPYHMRPVLVQVEPMQVGFSESKFTRFNVVFDGSKAVVESYGSDRLHEAKRIESYESSYFAANSAQYRPLYENALLKALASKCSVTGAVPHPEYFAFEFTYSCAT
jgi:hypothetical protein